MKRTLAIILALLMALWLASCGQSSQTTQPSESAASPSASAAAPSSSAQAYTGKTGDKPLDKVGFYDPNYDYSKNPRYKVQYMVIATGVLYEQFSDAFAHWASKMNVEYGGLWSAGGDNDVYINNITTFSQQGVNGFLLDPDITVYPRIVEVMNELKAHWMPCMGPPRDVTDPVAPLLHPCVGFDHYWFGTQMTDKLLEYKETAWPDVPLEKVGFIMVDFSISAPIHDRERGAEDRWKERTGLADNFFVADTATTAFTVDGANNLVTAIVSTEAGNFTHWLIAAAVDDLAQGAAAALDTLGLTDQGCVVTIGGSALQKQWDAGQQDAWRFALFTPQLIYAEPIIGALYAFMSGQATPETIWPSWVNAKDHGREGDTYASLLLPSFWISHENYKHFLEWSDVYAGANQYDYDPTGITRDSYPARMDIPDYYAG